MLKIILPDKRFLGPCYGIGRAFKKCLNLKNKEEFLLYGQLGHNKALYNYLERKGFVIIDDLKKAKNKKIIIRAHGINKKDLEFLKKNKIQFIDLTCSLVKRLLNMTLKFEREGYRIIIIGDKNHMEIKNVCTFLKKPIVIHDKIDVDKLHLFPRVAVFTQTTLTLKEISNILPFMKQKFKTMVYVPTRCPETNKRQSEAVKLARRVDLVLVVGDKISRNANNLVKVCKEITMAKLIQGQADFNKLPLSKIKKVGFISSASTPLFFSKKIIKCLKEKNFDTWFDWKS